jgi:hypothetical protein
MALHKMKPSLLWWKEFDEGMRLCRLVVEKNKNIINFQLNFLNFE